MKDRLNQIIAALLEPDNVWLTNSALAKKLGVSFNDVVRARRELKKRLSKAQHPPKNSNARLLETALKVTKILEELEEEEDILKALIMVCQAFLHPKPTTSP